MKKILLVPFVFSILFLSGVNLNASSTKIIGLEDGTIFPTSEMKNLTSVVNSLEYSKSIAENQDYDYLNEFYVKYGTSARTSSEVIQKFKNGTLPESYLRSSDPVSTNYSATIPEQGVLEETFVDTYSDGSISVRGYTTSNCTSGSGYSNCDVLWTTNNGSIDTYAKCRYTIAQGTNNDQVTKTYPGYEATSHVTGLKAYAESQYICRKSETSSKPASAEMEFVTEGLAFPTLINDVRFELNDGVKGIYSHMFGDTGYYVSC